MRNYIQELTEENTIVTQEKDLTISDERDEETECLTYRGKIIDKFRKHKARGIDGITTELINKAGPTLWNRMEEKMPRDWRYSQHTHTKEGNKDKCENYRGITLPLQIYKILSSVLCNRVVRYAEWF